MRRKKYRLKISHCTDKIQPILDVASLVPTCNVHTADKHQTGTDMDGRLTKESVFKDYSSAFKGTGLLPGECTVHTDSNMQSVVHPPCRIPIALKNRINRNMII